MKITVPIYVEEFDREMEDSVQYRAAPLFFKFSPSIDNRADLALTRLHRDLVKVFRIEALNMRHDDLAEMAFSPEFDERRLDLRLSIGSQTLTGRALFIIIRAVERFIAFSPRLPDFWFTFTDLAQFDLAAHDALKKHLRDLKTKNDEFVLESILIPRTAWTDIIEFEVSVDWEPPREQNSKVLLGGSGTVNGADALDTVGQCLEMLDGSELKRAAYREDVIDELERALARTSGRRQVLLLGPRGSGKTSVLHEYARRRKKKRLHKKGKKPGIWQLWPQRLISGMSIVGEWEERVLAIIGDVKKRNHILYFDDVLGLYSAGVCGGSDLSVAHVLMPFVKSGEIRMVAEMTPESFRILQEIDRGFADLFHVVRVDEPSEDQVIRMLVASMRRLEERHSRWYELDVLPTTLALCRRHARDVAFPGKAADLLQRAIARCSGKKCKREDVLREFETISGLSNELIDDAVKLDREDVLKALHEEVVSQDAAIDAMADAVCVAKARLGDPSRPIAVLLFLGPTGVGKTQCAKALARYLSGEDDKLVRFDMNEFVGPDAVDRLVGTFHEPDGLLTSAVRRRPCAVILFDEIEKAHPSVHDLLLQVTGEARLSDAVGRTTDFSNTIIILTSNIGTREAGSKAGFGREDGNDDASVYLQAAESFFRPEFFNRLDRIIPFSRLTREEVSRVARLQLERVFAREGLARRRCVLQIEPKALEMVVDEGFDPLFGARAIKRAIERRIAQPAAAEIAAFALDVFVVLRIEPGVDGVTVRVQGLEQADFDEECVASVASMDQAAVIELIEPFLDAITRNVNDRCPIGDIDVSSVSVEDRALFAARDRCEALRRRVRGLSDLMARQSSRSKQTRFARRTTRGSSGRPAARYRRMQWGHGHRSLVAAMSAGMDIEQYMKDCATTAGSGDGEIATAVMEIAQEAALLNFCVQPENAHPDRVLLELIPTRAEWPADTYCKAFTGFFERTVEMEVSRLDVGKKDDVVLLIEGCGATSMARLIEGTILHSSTRGTQVLVNVRATPMPASGTPQELYAEHALQQEQMADSLASNQEAERNDRFTFKPIGLLVHEGKMSVDATTGISVPGEFTADAMRMLVLSRLPSPVKTEDPA